METQVECLRLEGRRAVVQPEGPVARVSAKAVPALRGVEILVIPPDVDAFYGLNRFENLRIVEYGGTADVFAFQDSLDWLSEKLADEEAFLFRLATNAIGARPISPALTAIAAPRTRCTGSPDNAAVPEYRPCWSSCRRQSCRFPPYSCPHECAPEYNRAPRY